MIKHDSVHILTPLYMSMAKIVPEIEKDALHKPLEKPDLMVQA